LYIFFYNKFSRWFGVWGYPEVPWFTGVDSLGVYKLMSYDPGKAILQQLVEYNFREHMGDKLIYSNLASTTSQGTLSR
jgi:hypothetical protein